LVYVPADAIKGLPVDGVNLKPNSGMSVSKTEVGGEYGYCFSSAEQAEMVIAPSLLRGHETFSMQVYIPSGSAKLKGLGEFTFRIQRSVGASSEYIQFGPEASGTHRFTYDTWCEITVDYSSYSSTVGLFNLVIPAGARLYIRNFSVEGEAAEIPEGSEKPADGAVSGLAYQGGFTVNNASLLKTVEMAGEVAYRYGIEILLGAGNPTQHIHRLGESLEQARAVIRYRELSGSHVNLYSELTDLEELTSESTAHTVGVVHNIEGIEILNERFLALHIFGKVLGLRALFLYLLCNERILEFTAELRNDVSAPFVVASLSRNGNFSAPLGMIEEAVLRLKALGKIQNLLPPCIRTWDISYIDYPDNMIFLQYHLQI
jgi:hypothetical protein